MAQHMAVHMPHMPPGQPDIPRCVLHVHPCRALSPMYRVHLVPIAPAICPHMHPMPTLTVIHACPYDTSTCFGPDQHVPAAPTRCTPFPTHPCATAPLSCTLHGSYRPPMRCCHTKWSCATQTLSHRPRPVRMCPTLLGWAPDPSHTRANHPRCTVPITDTV